MPKSNNSKIVLDKKFNNNTSLFEIGIDEVGRGPMFGRVYTSAVILPYTCNSRINAILYPFNSGNSLLLHV